MGWPEAIFMSCLTLCASVLLAIRWGLQAVSLIKGALTVEDITGVEESENHNGEHV